MFIQTETTPNPASLKFLPGRIVLGTGTAEFRDRRRGRRARRSPSGCSRSTASAASSSAAISSPSPRPTASGSTSSPRCSARSWSISCPACRCSGPRPDETAGDEFFAEEDAETVATIKELIETRVRPAVAQDGGDITFQGFRDGVVYLNMRGSCAGCPSSTATLKHGIENLLRHFVPEVQEIREVAA